MKTMKKHILRIPLGLLLIAIFAMTLAGCASVSSVLGSASGVASSVGSTIGAVADVAEVLGVDAEAVAALDSAAGTASSLGAAAGSVSNVAGAASNVAGAASSIGSAADAAAALGAVANTASSIGSAAGAVSSAVGTVSSLGTAGAPAPDAPSAFLGSGSAPQPATTPALAPSAAPNQNRPRLGILPFTGGSASDGENIAVLLSIQDDLRAAFSIVPRTGAVNTAVAQRDFQTSTSIDSDAIARLGRMHNVDYVVSGYMRRLGNRNLIVAAIVNVETLALVAGDYRQYNSIEEIPAMLPSIARNMAATAGRAGARLPGLAIAPLRYAERGANTEYAEALAQILPIAIANTGGYAVLPRASAVQTALNQQGLRSDSTAEDMARAAGMAINAAYVLAAETLSMGSMNMFIVQILNAENGSQLAGESLNYRVIDDGIALMPQLAAVLAGRTGAAVAAATSPQGIAQLAAAPAAAPAGVTALGAMPSREAATWQRAGGSRFLINAGLGISFVYMKTPPVSASFEYLFPNGPSLGALIAYSEHRWDDNYNEVFSMNAKTAWNFNTSQRIISYLGLLVGYCLENETHKSWSGSANYFSSLSFTYGVNAGMRLFFTDHIGGYVDLYGIHAPFVVKPEYATGEPRGILAASLGLALKF